MIRRRRIVVAALAALAVVFIGVVVLPTRTWFGQRQALSSAEARLQQIRSASGQLEEKIDRLSDKASIERQARQEYGYVAVGEESYTVPPAQPPRVNLPAVWPFDRLQEPLQRAAERGRTSG